MIYILRMSQISLMRNLSLIHNCKVKTLFFAKQQKIILHKLLFKCQKMDTSI